MLDNITSEQTHSTSVFTNSGAVFEKRLFKKHSNGSVGDYIIKVFTNDDDVVILSRAATKVIGGKPNTTITPVTEGKNIGKANETSPLQQAVKEAETKVKAQLKKGYVISVEDTDKPVTNQHGDPLPLLAKKFQDIKYIPFPVSLQRKYNGHRLIAIIKQSLVHLYSREGTPVNMPHISTPLQTAFNKNIWDGTPLDGELYRHNWSLEKISSMAKKLRPESVELTYNIYDAIAPTHDFLARSHIIATLFEAIEPCDSLCHVETLSANNYDEMYALDRQFIEEGFEGTMVRLAGEGYVGGRHGQLIKMKRYHDAEFKIVGSRLGKPFIKGNKTYQLPIWVLETTSGKRFDCTAQGSMIERHALYEQGLDTFYGKSLNVRYWELSDRGVPPHAVAKYFITPL